MLSAHGAREDTANSSVSSLPDMVVPAAGLTKKSGPAGFLERIYRPLGFTKTYNFVLFVLLVGALMGFTLARLSYFNFAGILCRPDGDPRAINNATPGECYYLLQTTYKTGMIIHLAGILPAAFLACFQFVPKIRHKVIIIHRMSGYTVIVLSMVATAGALVIARHSFGGGLDTQSAIGFLAIIFLFSNFMAYVNIKRLQIEQHRAWMLRAWVYVSTKPNQSRVVWLQVEFLTCLVPGWVGCHHTLHPHVGRRRNYLPRRILLRRPVLQDILDPRRQRQHAGRLSRLCRGL